MLPPIAFTESEAIAIFFACRSLQYFGSLPFEDGAATALGKFYHYLPADIREQIDRLKNRVVIWHPHRPMSTTSLQTLLQAVMARSVVTIDYRSGHGLTRRDIQPIGLYASQGYWYCPAYCFKRDDVRLFRADRIHGATINATIACREDVDARSVLEWNAPEEAAQEQTLLVASLTPNGVRSLETSSWFGHAIELAEDGSGLIRRQVPVDKVAFFADMVWNLGADARILEPESAIAHVRQKLAAMSQLYA
jgi:predicted DNA-binding transcriptional regulator YafY